mmetsp:Transcript_12929/g.17678  ORF Transcript_12929/g.17678 Transcript_12929/m.17678 type:complete len:264 (+) Transcript_12929:420-1211(+)
MCLNASVFLHVYILHASLHCESFLVRGQRRRRRGRACASSSTTCEPAGPQALEEVPEAPPPPRPHALFLHCPVTPGAHHRPTSDLSPHLRCTSLWARSLPPDTTPSTLPSRPLAAIGQGRIRRGGLGGARGYRHTIEPPRSRPAQGVAEPRRPATRRCPPCEGRMPAGPLQMAHPTQAPRPQMQSPSGFLFRQCSTWCLSSIWCYDRLSPSFPKFSLLVLQLQLLKHPQLGVWVSQSTCIQVKTKPLLSTCRWNILYVKLDIS